MAWINFRHGAFAILASSALGLACKPRDSSSHSLAAEELRADLIAVLQADQQQPLTPAELAASPSEIQQAAQGGPLAGDAGAALLSAFQLQFRDCRFSGVETPLIQALKKNLKPFAVPFYQQKMASFQESGFSRVALPPGSPKWREFAETVQAMDCLGLALADIWPQASPPKHRFYFRTANEVQNLNSFFHDIAWTPNTAPPPDDDGKFLQQLTSAFEFIDFLDLLVNMVPDAPMVYPRQNRPIWTIYDGDGNGPANLDGWRQAQTLASAGAGPALKELYGIISHRFAEFSFRDRRVVGGGDLDPPAGCSAQSWLTNTKFFRASRRQVTVLRSNPMVATQWCDDGGTDPEAGIIAQYEYPSARTYAFPVPAATQGALGQQPARFAELLSPELKARLDDAKTAGQLASDDTPEFKELTRAIIEELVAGFFKDWPAGNPASYPYQLMMSVHPSDDYNGRSLRSWYRAYESRRSAAVAPAGVPLFLTDFNLDLYTSPEEFFEITLVSARLWGRLMAAYMAERQGGRKYYDAPFQWAVAANCDRVSSEAAVVNRVRTWFRDEGHLNLVRTKQKFDVDKGLAAAVQGICN